MRRANQERVMMDAATKDAGGPLDLEWCDAARRDAAPGDDAPHGAVTPTGAAYSPALVSPSPVSPSPVSAARQLTDVLPGFEQIAGFLTLPEAELLFAHARAVTAGCIIDVGSYRGRSTAALCAGVSAGPTAGKANSVPVYAIDPHEAFTGVKGGKYGHGDRREFFKNMVEVRMVRYVRLLNATSRMLSPGWHMPVALLYLDGDHRYDATLADFEAWRPHLVDGATVMFADAAGEGPWRVIAEFAARQMLTKVEQIGKIAVFRFSSADQPPMVYAKPVPKKRLVQKDLDMNAVAFHVYYGGGGKYLYQGIPKCACTTIKTLLLELEGLPIDKDEWKRHQKSQNKFPGVLWMSPQQRDDLFQDRTNTFKFVVVRDPYTRLASAYKDKILTEPKEGSDYWLNIIRDAAREQGVELADVPSFEQFVHVVSQQPVEQMDSHWRQQYFEGRFGLITYNFVGHMEKMQSDLPYILERIGAPQALQDKAGEQHNATGAGMAIWDGVSPDIRRKFMNAFEIDFDTLCYPYRMPRTP